MFRLEYYFIFHLIWLLLHALLLLFFRSANCVQYIFLKIVLLRFSLENFCVWEEERRKSKWNVTWHALSIKTLVKAHRIHTHTQTHAQTIKIVLEKPIDNWFNCIAAGTELLYTWRTHTKLLPFFIVHNRTLYTGEEKNRNHNILHSNVKTNIVYHVKVAAWEIMYT